MAGSGTRLRSAMPPSPFRGTPSSSTRTPVAEAPRRTSCSLWPRPPLCWRTTPGASATSTPTVETSARREPTSTTVVRPVGSRTRGDSGGGGAAGTGTSTGGSSTAGDCPQAIDATLNAGPRHARAHHHPPIVRLPLSSPKREGRRRRRGSPVPHPRAGLLAHGGERGRRPDGAFHVRIRPPTFPQDVRARSGDRWRMSNRPGSSGRFRSQWRDRAGLSPASLLGPTWAPGVTGCLAQPTAVAQADGGRKQDFALTRPRCVIDAGQTMRLRLFLLLLAATACVHGFNPVSVKHWYPPPDTDTQQLCTGDRAARCTDQALALIEPTAAQKEPDRAARLLGAACEQGDERACKTLDTRYTAPKRLNPIPNDIGHGLPKASASYGAVACTITVEGEAIKCR